MFMYRVELDPARRETLSALVNPNKIHGAIEKARPGERTRILWRIDTVNSNKYLLMVSSAEFDAQKLADQFGFPNGKAQVKNYDPLLDKVTDGSVWRFRLSANPVRAIKREHQGQRGKLMGLTVNQQMAWLSQKAEKYGFQVHPEQTRVMYSRWIKFKKAGTGQDVSLRESVFEGVLTVTDSESFKRVLTDGFGRGKAYGLGLLTIVPYHG